MLEAALDRLDGSDDSECEEFVGVSIDDARLDALNDSEAEDLPQLQLDSALARLSDGSGTEIENDEVATNTGPDGHSELQLHEEDDTRKVELLYMTRRDLKPQYRHQLCSLATGCCRSIGLRDVCRTKQSTWRKRT